ncbi:MAG: radical SAM protein [candidate division Zixibacteria bacterium]|nr:radical SAM protein [candidate division Zixibacteria bacterium]
MRVVFIYPDLILHRLDWTGYFYVGIASLSAVLKREGHQTSLIHITQPVSRSDFIKEVKRECADLIGLTSTSHMFPFVKKLTSWLVEGRVDVPTIYGGIHPTIAPEESIGAEGIDMICRGEGEATLSELCQKMEDREDTSNIRNLWVKRNGNITKNPLRPLLDDLDSLPFPDRSIFSDYRNLYRERERKGSFVVSRGCPYNCTYCCNHLMREIYRIGGEPVRFRSVDNVIAEMKEVIESYPFINTVVFDDDILFLKRKWAEEFAEKYRRNVNLPFVCNARANLIDEAMVGLLKKAGCYHVKFGLESGNENICNKVLNRHLTTEQIKNAFALCKAAGLITESFNMVGIPYETPGAILDTIKLNAMIGVDKMHVSIFQPYQGTKLADLCREQAFLVSKELGPDLFSPSVLRLPTITASQVFMFRDYFKVLVRHYQMLQRLPDRISRITIRLSDTLLSSPPVSKIFNLIYIPLNYLFRGGQFLRVRAKVAWPMVTDVRTIRLKKEKHERKQPADRTYPI